MKLTSPTVPIVNIYTKIKGSHSHNTRLRERSTIPKESSHKMSKAIMVKVEMIGLVIVAVLVEKQLCKKKKTTATKNVGDSQRPN